jgi:hypothetical protein
MVLGSAADQLEPGETVLWTGVSTSGRVFHPLDLYSTLIGLVWMMWTSFVLSGMPIGANGRVATIAVCLLGPIMSLQEVVRRRIRWRRETYVLTGKRAFIVDRDKPSAIRERRLNSSTCKAYSIAASGRGILVFFPSGPMSTIVYGLAEVIGYRVFDFVNIQDVAALRALVDELKSRK